MKPEIEKQVEDENNAESPKARVPKRSAFTTFYYSFYYLLLFSVYYFPVTFI